MLEYFKNWTPAIHARPYQVMRKGWCGNAGTWHRLSSHPDIAGARDRFAREFRKVRKGEICVVLPDGTVDLYHCAPTETGKTIESKSDRRVFQKVPTLLTIGKIAELLDMSVHRCIYAQRTRGITPAGRVGNLFFFNESHIQEIKTAVQSLRPDRRTQVTNWESALQE